MLMSEIINDYRSSYKPSRDRYAAPCSHFQNQFNQVGNGVRGRFNRQAALSLRPPPPLVLSTHCPPQLLSPDVTGFALIGSILSICCGSAANVGADGSAGAERFAPQSSAPTRWW